MLKSIELTSVLKHKRLRVDFSDGLNILRGANEAGKSSLLEGLGYNWFGVSALEKGLDDSIHWGEKKSSFKTKTVFDVAGKEFICTRGASGAELSCDGDIIVTGQKEVTLKIEELFGLPAGKAQDIIFAAQNSIRGVLSSGPAAAAEFVEKLGDFGQADDLIRAFTGKVITGPVKSLDQQIERVEADLLEANAEVAPDPEPIESDIKCAKESLEVAREDFAKARETMQDIKIRTNDVEGKKATLLASLNQAKEAARNFAVAEEALRKKANTLSSLQKKQVAYAAQVEAWGIWDAYRLFQGIPVTDDYWEGNTEDLRAEVRRVEAEQTQAASAVSGLKSEIIMLQKNKVTATHCPTCERAFDNIKEIAATNKRVDEKIEKASSELEVGDAVYKDSVSYSKELAEVAELGHQAETNIGAIPDESVIKIDRGQVPPAVAWLPPVPEPVTLGDPVDDVEIIRAEEAQKQLDSLIAPDPSIVAELEEQIAAIPPAVTNEECSAAEHAEFAAGGKINSLEAQIAVSEKKLAEARAMAVAFHTRKNELTRQAARVKTDRKELEANNAVLKELRTARSKVTELLWNKVLGSTSAFFSQFRGRQSSVSKGPSGFIVDGSSSRSSGSTLDVLGLALRITIAKMFSNCGVLILDEPSAGCDAERTALMTSGLMTAGFDQIILVTHKESDESAGGNLIQL